MKSEKFFEEAKKIFPGGVNSPVRYYDPYPIFIKSGKGSKIYDVDNREYVDFCLAYGPLILGHLNDQVKKAVQRKMENGWLFGAPTEEEILLGKLINEAVPYIEMMRFVNSGTEGTMHTIRLVRAFTNKKRIVKIIGGYHGAHDSVLVSPGSGAIGKPSSAGIPEEVTSNTFVVEYNDIETLENIFRNYKNEIAGLIIEPVLGNAGVILPDKEYLKNVREITSENDALLIFDEVITGFRFHYGTAGQYFSVIPDLTILGKIVGGGFPLAIFGGRKDIMEKISPQGNVYQAGTFSGNPISVTAGITTLKILKNKDYHELGNKVKIIEKFVNDLKEDKRREIQFNSMVSMFQIFFNKNPVKRYSDAINSDSVKYKEFFNKMLKKGFYLPPSQFESLFLSFAHTKKEIYNFGKIIYDEL
ncbi:MAG: glutamate-1-semialdehyde 2,1-aminomutase [Thermoplasmata archaeon]